MITRGTIFVFALKKNMITGITKNKHGFADYSYVPVVLAAPKFADFEEDKSAAIICRATASFVLGYSLLTDAKWGAVKIIPYKTHAALDLAVGVATLAASGLLKKSGKRARVTLILMGLTGIVVGTLSMVGAKNS